MGQSTSWGGARFSGRKKLDSANRRVSLRLIPAIPSRSTQTPLTANIPVSAIRLNKAEINFPYHRLLLTSHYPDTALLRQRLLCFHSRPATLHSLHASRPPRPPLITTDFSRVTAFISKILRIAPDLSKICRQFFPKLVILKNRGGRGVPAGRTTRAVAYRKPITVNQKRSPELLLESNTSYV